MGTQIARIAHRTVRLTNAQIKALPSTPVELVPDPGRSKVIQFLWGFANVQLNGATAYTNLTDGAHLDLVLGASTLVATPVLQKSSESRTDLASLLAGTAGALLSPVVKSSTALGSTIAQTVTYSAARHAALNVKITGNSGDLTGGHVDNVLELTVYYAVLLREVQDLVFAPARGLVTVSSVMPTLGRTYKMVPPVGSLAATGAAPTILGGGKISRAPGAGGVTLVRSTPTVVRA